MLPREKIETSTFAARPQKWTGVKPCGGSCRRVLEKLLRKPVGGCSAAPVTLAKRNKTVWNLIHSPPILVPRLLPALQFPWGVISLWLKHERRGTSLQGGRAPGMAEVGQCLKSGGAASAGLRGFGFDNGKNQEFFTFPAESSLCLPD